MKYGRLADFSFAGLSFFPFPMFLGGYPVLAGFVFLVLLAAAGLLGLVEQLKGNGRAGKLEDGREKGEVRPAEREVESRSPVTDHGSRFN